jgi:GNAT superfamily N-acetyltransferase
VKKQNLIIRRLAPDSSVLKECAQWRYDAFFQGSEVSLEDSYLQLVETTSSDFEAAYIAEVSLQPVGICMFVKNELNPRHDLTPWLASLYVAPEFRKQGIGSELVRFVENHAREQGIKCLHLYTASADKLYSRCGWVITERFDWDGQRFLLMQRKL